MTQAQLMDPRHTQDVVALLETERAKSLSPREWAHRLRGHGLCIEGGEVLTTLHRRRVCAVPAHLV